MTQVTTGMTVHVHYTGRLESGDEFDSSREREPLTVTLGAGQVIPGFEAALLEMSVGDTKTVNIPVDQAYGPRQDQLLHKVPLTEFPPDPAPQIGIPLLAQTPDGQQIRLEIVELDDEHAVLDANHPLAGKALIFDLELVSIVENQD